MTLEEIIAKADANAVEHPQWTVKVFVNSKEIPTFPKFKVGDTVWIREFNKIDTSVYVREAKVSSVNLLITQTKYGNYTNKFYQVDGLDNLYNELSLFSTKESAEENILKK